MMPANASLAVLVAIDPTFSAVMEGRFEMRGMLRGGEGAGLSLEYDAKGLGATWSETETIALPLGGLRGLDYRRWMRRGVLRLRPARMALPAALPGVDPRRLDLKVARRDREAARLPAARVHAALAGAPPAAPFTAAADRLGLADVIGLAYLADGFLVLDTARRRLETFVGDFEVFKIEPAALSEVAFARGRAADRLTLRPRRPDLLTAFPGAHDEALRLRLQKADRPDAERLLEALRGCLARAGA